MNQPQKKNTPVIEITLGLICAVLSLSYLEILADRTASDLQQMQRILMMVVGIVITGTVATVLTVIRTYKYGFHYKKMQFAVLVVMLMGFTGMTFHYRLPDAFRHAYASAFITYYANDTVALQLGNAVEWVTSYKPNNLFNSGMDHCNNRSGRIIAQDIKQKNGSWYEVERAVETAYKQGNLILSKHDHADILACYTEHFPEKRTEIEQMAVSRKNISSYLLPRSKRK